MPELFDKAKAWVNRFTEIGLGLIALALVAQILFGRTIPFTQVDITANLTDLFQSLGDNGLVGLIALAIIIWMFQRRQPD